MKAYSWNSGTNYGYIMDPSSPNEAYWGPKLSASDDEIVKEWASNCSDAEYIAHFNDLQAKMSPIKLGTASQYLGITDACSVQGPAGKDGRGIETIRQTAGGAGFPTTTYEIVYNDGTTSEFEVHNGIDGKDGVGSPGDNGISSKFVMIYRSGILDETGIYQAPPRPEGGSWDGTSNNIKDLPSEWTRNDEIAPPVYMSSRTFASNPDVQDPEWSTPVQISGEDGTPGADGLTTEFIYIRQREAPTNIDQLESPPNVPGYVPGGGWTPSPSGIEEDNPTEWMCIRKKDKDGNWGPWEGPSRWAQYGVNGQDGDGVQYIYYRENDGIKPTNPTINGYQTNQGYQDKYAEWVPSEDNYSNYRGHQVVNGTNWKDNPSGVDKDHRFEWVAQRKFRRVSWSNPPQEHRWMEFSEPTLWAKYGEKGESAFGVRTMFITTSGTDEIPEFNKYEPNPGNGWTTTFPSEYEAGVNVVWAINAIIHFGYVDNNNDGEADFFVDPSVGWEGPYLSTGTKGADGNPIDYTQIYYAYAASKPGQPNTGVELDKVGTTKDEQGNDIPWYTFPEQKYEDGTDNTKRWYQCTAHVDGKKKIIKEWGPVQTLNGLDGQAKDGNRYEYRFGVSPDQTSPRLVQSRYDEGAGTTSFLRIPLTLDAEGNEIEGWKLTDSSLSVPDGGTMWMIWAQIDPNDKVVLLEGKAWSGPLRVSGPQGVQGIQGEIGPAGQRGFTGTPGSSLNTLFCKGTTDTYEGSDEWENKVENPKGWEKVAPQTEGDEYIWCIQGHDIYKENISEDETTNSFVKTGVDWVPPFKVSGSIGPAGPAGNRGQIVYPMGIYNPNEVYITTEDKAPYVYDADAKCFYVYNNMTMPWCGERPADYTDTSKYGQKYYFAGSPVAEQGADITPGIHYANCINADKTPSWVILESFQALYTNIAIIANGLVGSAVFNNEFMFSQQGMDKSGAPSTQYEKFLDGYDAPHTPSNPTDYWVYAGSTTQIADKDVDPYEKNGSGTPIHGFRPNVCINFKTGEIWCSKGDVNFDTDGSGYIAGGNISWKENGEVTIGLLDDYAKNSELKGFLTEEALEGYITNDTLSEYALKKDLADYASKKDLTELAEQLNEYKKVINGWTADNMITTLEKTELLIRLNEIKSEYNNLLTSAAIYGIKTDNYTNAKNIAVTTLEYYTQEMDKDTELSEDYPLENLYEYYEQREALRFLIQQSAYTNTETKVSDSMNEMATKLGYSDYEELVEKAKNDQTIIKGGYINTTLIETDAIVTKVLTSFDITASNIEQKDKKWGLLTDGSSYFASSSGITNANIVFNNDGSGYIGNPSDPGIVWESDGTLFINRNAGEKMKKLDAITIDDAGYDCLFTPEYTTMYVYSVGSKNSYAPTLNIKISPIFNSMDGYKGTLKIINTTENRFLLSCDTNKIETGSNWYKVFLGFRNNSTGSYVTDIILPPYSNFSFDLYAINQFILTQAAIGFTGVVYNQFNNYHADGVKYPCVLAGNKVLLRDIKVTFEKYNNAEYIVMRGITNCDKIVLETNGAFSSTTVGNIIVNTAEKVTFNQTSTGAAVGDGLHSLLATSTGDNTLFSMTNATVGTIQDYVKIPTTTTSIEFAVREHQYYPVLTTYYYFAVYVECTKQDGTNLLTDTSYPIVRFFNDVGECGYHTLG